MVESRINFAKIICSVSFPEYNDGLHASSGEVNRKQKKGKLLDAHSSRLREVVCTIQRRVIIFGPTLV